MNNTILRFVPEQHIDYDESMMKYFGCKQFIRGKPISFGYKVWSVNSKEGLMNLEIYQGEGVSVNTAHDRPFIKAAEDLTKKRFALSILR